jgi:hypothetical protein
MLSEENELEVLKGVAKSNALWKGKARRVKCLQHANYCAKLILEPNLRSTTN